MGCLAASALAACMPRPARRAQALWIAPLATVGFMVSLLKTTSLASIIGIVDLTKTGTMVANLSFEPMLVYGIVAAIYFTLCWPLSLLSRRLERLQHGAR